MGIPALWTDINLFTPTKRFVLTCTTTGAETLTLALLNVKVGKQVLVDWGDGRSNLYTTSAAARTHAYAGAGTWTVTMYMAENITKLSINDAKISGVINAANPMPVGLTYLYIHTLAGLTWTVGAAAPMPVGLTSLTLFNLAGLTWTVGAAAPMPVNLTTLTLYDTTGITWTVGAAAPMPVGLTSLTLFNLAGLTWTVGAAAPMPVGLTYLYIRTLASLAWTVGAAAPMPVGLTTLSLTDIAGLTWTVGAAAPMPVGLTSLTLFNLAGLTAISDWTGINAIKAIQYENNLNVAAVDGVLAGIWNNKPNFTWATPTLDLLGGGNATPSGVYASVCPPTAGMEWRFDLVNGICTPAGPEWAVTTA